MGNWCIKIDFSFNLVGSSFFYESGLSPNFYWLSLSGRAPSHAPSLVWLSTSFLDRRALTARVSLTPEKGRPYFQRSPLAWTYKLPLLEVGQSVIRPSSIIYLPLICYCTVSLVKYVSRFIMVSPSSNLCSHFLRNYRTITQNIPTNSRIATFWLMTGITICPSHWPFIYNEPAMAIVKVDFLPRPRNCLCPAMPWWMVSLLGSFVPQFGPILAHYEPFCALLCRQ